MLGRAKQFAALDGQRRKLFVEAYFLLGLMRFSLLRKPFTQLVSQLQIHREKVTQPPQEPAAIEWAQVIGWAVTVAARNTPWDSTCLVQVLAAQRMLAKRGIAGVFYIGATTAVNDNESVELLAHAWLQCNDEFITGEPGHQAYTVVSAFSWS
ncbi:MAG: lasso peptide biosynthesis B2 protein [Xanthomonadales bacterium]|nr:lasso peptide biosynthesis B2 protein [Xanthomonadales bacterium]